MPRRALSRALVVAVLGMSACRKGTGERATIDGPAAGDHSVVSGVKLARDIAPFGPIGQQPDAPLPEGALVRLGTAQLRHGGQVTGISLSSDGTVLATAGGDDHTARIWDPVSGQERRMCGGHSFAVEAVALTPDGTIMASGGGSVFRNAESGGDAEIRLWEVASGKELRRLKGHPYRISSLAFSPDGKMVASASFDGSMRLWETASGDEISFGGKHAKGVQCVCFSPDGKKLASCSADRTICLWEVASGQNSAARSMICQRRRHRLRSGWRWISILSGPPPPA